MRLALAGGSLHSELREGRIAGRILQLELVEHGIGDGGDHQVAVRLGVGRDDGPRRPGCVCGGQQLLIGLLVEIPLLAHLDVAHVELPVLGWVVEPLLQALSLLVLGDVQHELEDDRAVFGQHALEVVDLRIALLLLLVGDPAVDHRHQHVFVLAAVEDHDLARARHLLVDAPQIVMRALHLGGRLPTDRAHAQRAHLAKHAARRAILARRVHALQDHQQLEAAVGVKDLLQRIKRFGDLGHPGLVVVFLSLGKGLGRGIEGAELELATLAFLAILFCVVGLGLPLLPQLAEQFVVELKRGKERLRHGTGFLVRRGEWWDQQGIVSPSATQGAVGECAVALRAPSPHARRHYSVIWAFLMICALFRLSFCSSASNSAAL
ncbi:hypothetical protein SDC9_98302 [bioreactor metagenome]|uniref:Uncharacterized protein n=1 Tax=bioreactor metagenome TaxID=1076179 RepID=A0A645AL29_9ZZZZ